MMQDDALGLFSALVTAQIEAWNRVDAAAKAVDRMSAARLQILGTVAGCTGGIGITEIARRQHISDGAASKLCDRLAKDGLVTRKRAENDRRRQVVVCTQEGADALGEAAASAREACGTFFACLSSEERRTLLDLLNKLKGNDQGR